MNTVEHWDVSFVSGLGALPVAAVALGVVAVAAWHTTTLVRTLGWTTGTVMLVVLRCALLCLTLGMFAQAHLTIATLRAVPHRIAVLVDASASMDLPSKQRAVATTLGRLAATKNTAPQPPELSWWCFHDTLQPATYRDGAVHCPSDTRHRTDLWGALRAVTTHAQPLSLSAVVLVSDGIHTADTPVHTPPVPVFSVPISGELSPGAVAVETVQHAPFAFARKPIPVGVTLRYGGGGPATTTVSVRRNDALVTEKQVRLSAPRTAVRFTLHPRTLGSHVYTVSVAPTPKDDTAADNTRHFQINVTRDKVRVLHLSGSPNWDQRFLRAALQELPTVDLVSFYVLRTKEQSQTRPRIPLSLIPFPTEELFSEHLGEFDIIVAHDFSLSEAGVDRFADDIAQFAHDGGALIAVMGPHALADPAWHRPPLADVLPVAVDQERIAAAFSRYAEATLLPTIPPAALSHPLWGFATEPPHKSQWVRTLPPLHGFAPVTAVRPAAATVLQGLWEGASVPLIAASDTPGKALFVGTPSLWAWRFAAHVSGVPGTPFSSWWKQVVRWATDDPALARLRIAVQPASPTVHEETTVAIHAADTRHAPAAGRPVSVIITRTDGTEELRTRATTDSRGAAHISWSPAVAGPHRILAEAVDQEAGASLRARWDVLVREPSSESPFAPADRAALQRLARRTGGALLSPASAARVFTHLPPRTTRTASREIPLWRHPATVALWIALFLGDIALRRRRGLR